MTDHIATGPSYSATTRKRVGTSYFYTDEDVERHVRLCKEHGLAPGVRWRRKQPVSNTPSPAAQQGFATPRRVT